jgi:hypothetical protein
MAQMGDSGPEVVDGESFLDALLLPNASALACRREERVQKAFSVDHHGPGVARLSMGASRLLGK